MNWLKKKKYFFINLKAGEWDHIYHKFNEMEKDILQIKDLLMKGEKIKIYSIIRKYE